MVLGTPACDWKYQGLAVVGEGWAELRTALVKAAG